MLRPIHCNGGGFYSGRNASVTHRVHGGGRPRARPSASVRPVTRAVCPIVSVSPSRSSGRRRRHRPPPPQSNQDETVVQVNPNEKERESGGRDAHARTHAVGPLTSILSSSVRPSAAAAAVIAPLHDGGGGGGDGDSDD